MPAVDEIAITRPEAWSSGVSTSVVDSIAPAPAPAQAQRLDEAEHTHLLDRIRNRQLPRKRAAADGRQLNGSASPSSVGSTDR